MINIKEAGAILISIIILAFVVSFPQPFYVFFIALGLIALVILINVFVKKVIAYYYESEIEEKIWSMQRYGFPAHHKLEKKIPVGVIIPFLFSLVTLGGIKLFTSLVFDIKPKVYRSAKRHGLYSFSEMTEFHIAVIAASGVIANLIAAILAYLLNFPDFARLNIYYAFFNAIPFDELDGNKIFAGSLILWSFVAAIVLIAVGYALLLI
jgi:hypothetical protein